MPHGRWMRLLVGVTLATSLLAPQSFAQSPASPVVPAPSAVQVGVAGAVQGLVQISSGPTVGMVVESGRPIYLGDVVTTGAEGRLQVLLLDETVFTVGPSSSIVIDEFVYDPATSDGKITAQVLKGAFRFVTGKIAHKKPENMKVTLPAGTIGVRGTIVAGRVEGQSSLVALLGPGPDNNVGARVGRIEVSNPVEGQLAMVMVTQPGFGTTIPGANLPPTPPAMVPPQVMAALQHDLAAPQNNSETNDEARPRSGGPQGPFRPDGAPQGDNETSGPVGPAGQHRPASGPTPEEMAAWNSGDPDARAALKAKYGSTGGGTAPNAGPMPMPGPAGYDPNAGFQQTFNNFGTFDPYVAASTAYNQTTTAAQTASTTIQNGIAAREQLTQIQTGQFHWQGVGPFVQTRKLGQPVNIGGDMLVKMNIDFGNRTIGGGLSQVQVTTTGGGGNIGVSMPIAVQSFNNAGPAMFHQTQTNAGSIFNFDYAVQNVNGVLGQGLGVHGHYLSTDGQNVGDGVNNLPRLDGPVQ